MARASTTTRRSARRGIWALDTSRSMIPENAALPAVAVLPLVQHTGVPARCVVKAGDEVREGSLIGRAEGHFSAHVHASIPGTVLSVAEMTLPNGVPCEAVSIRLGGAFDHLGKRRDAGSPTAGSPETILRALAECGVVEMAGAQVPLHVRWDRTLLGGARRLVINALRTEPMLNIAEVLVQHRCGDLADAIAALLPLFGGERAVTLMLSAEGNGPNGVGGEERNGAVVRVDDSPGRHAGGELRAEGNAAGSRAVRPGDYAVDPDSATTGSASGDMLDAACAARGIRLETMYVPLKYPIDPAREYAARRGESVAAELVDPSTLLAAHDALFRGLPLVQRHILVAGGAVARPSVLKVRIGTPLGDAVEECGGFAEPPARLVLGGSMSGQTVVDLASPILKGTRALLALSHGEVANGAVAPCIGCGRCVTACPEGLVPSALYKRVERGDLIGAAARGLADCTTCGFCSYVCPSHLALSGAFHFAKAALRAEKTLHD